MLSRVVRSGSQCLLSRTGGRSRVRCTTPSTSCSSPRSWPLRSSSTEAGILQVGPAESRLSELLSVLAGFAAIAAGSSLLGRISGRRLVQPVLGRRSRWDRPVIHVPGAGQPASSVVPGRGSRGSARRSGGPQDQGGARSSLAFLSAFTGWPHSRLGDHERRNGARERFFERYLIVLVPLLVLAFLCWLEDRRKGRWVAVTIGFCDHRPRRARAVVHVRGGPGAR